MIESPNLFQRWMGALGFNGQEKSKAAALIGVTRPNTISEIVSGKRELTETQRLAMAAIRAGLEPWSPENDADAVSLRDLKEMIDRKVEERSPAKRRANAA